MNPDDSILARSLTLKAESFDYEGQFSKTDVDLTAAPVSQVMLDGTPSGEGDDYDDTLSACQGSEGKSQLNLKSGHFTASGTYIVSVESGDPDSHAFVPQRVTTFEIELCLLTQTL